MKLFIGEFSPLRIAEIDPVGGLDHLDQES